MSVFVKTVPNGRRILIQRIKERFDRIETFPKLFSTATRFHNEISANPFINTIITTNWDDYFEQICGATPIIDNKDTALWNIFDRRVFKIHGSINNIGSIVATNEDYEKCYKRLTEEIIGDRLKTLLSSRTVIFIGFSFGDEDLNRLIDILSNSLEDFANQYYLVTLDNKWIEKPDKRIIPIITDGTYFIHRLNNILIKDGVLNSSDLYTYAFEIREFIESFHLEWFNSDTFKSNLKTYPELLLSVAYQDGFIHALDRCMADKKYGNFLSENYLQPYISSYNFLYEDRLGKHSYDMAYYDLGYLDGLISLSLFIEDGEGGFPGLFTYSEEYFESENEVIEAILKNRDNDLFNFCNKKGEQFGDDDVPEFRPWFC